MASVVTSAEFKISLNAVITGTNDQGNPLWTPALTKTLQFTNGTIANRFDLLFTDTRSVGSASNDDLDIIDALINGLNEQVQFLKPVGIIIISAAANTTVLTVGAGTNPYIAPWIATGDGIKVGPGGVFCLVDPDVTGIGAAVAGTGDILRVANAAGATASYDVAIFGRSV